MKNISVSATQKKAIQEVLRLTSCNQANVAKKSGFSASSLSEFLNKPDKQIRDENWNRLIMTLKEEVLKSNSSEVKSWWVSILEKQIGKIEDPSLPFSPVAINYFPLREQQEVLSFFKDTSFGIIVAGGYGSGRHSLSNRVSSLLHETRELIPVVDLEGETNVLEGTLVVAGIDSLYNLEEKTKIIKIAPWTKEFVSRLIDFYVINENIDSIMELTGGQAMLTHRLLYSLRQGDSLVDWEGYLKFPPPWIKTLFYKNLEQLGNIAQSYNDEIGSILKSVIDGTLDRKMNVLYGDALRNLAFVKVKNDKLVVASRWAEELIKFELNM